MNNRLRIGNVSKTVSQRQHGIGIVEVLVALVVVSFGVLGMASLQLTGMKQSTGGFNRSKALMFTENVASRMRINKAGVEAAHYGDFVSSGGLACGTIPKLCQATQKNANPPKCTSAELAAYDLFSVACGDIDSSNNAREGVTSALPEGQLSVSCDDKSSTGSCEPGSTHTITVSWQEGSVASDDKTAVVDRFVRVRLQP